jgi:hypothetical protein
MMSGSSGSSASRLPEKQLSVSGWSTESKLKIEREKSNANPAIEELPGGSRLWIAVPARQDRWGPWATSGTGD